MDSRAVMLGLLGRPGCPDSLDDIDIRIMVAFAEGILRENEDNAALLDDLYAPPREAAADSRADEIAAFISLVE